MFRNRPIATLVEILEEGKENHQEWFGKLKSGLVFNDLCEVFQGKKDNDEKKIANSNSVKLVEAQEFSEPVVLDVCMYFIYSIFRVCIIYNSYHSNPRGLTSSL